ncbi:MAG: sigma-70 family RNA polymerase sigma factor [Planctomycetes bacterium]|nr:sigma-70 family RNA polymerase sigma factor [Planctomycetota bacterium]
MKPGEGSVAFDDLVRRHMAEAYAFCFRLTGRAAEAEDLSQEGFVAAYRALPSFRGESSFRSWLFQILVNRWRDRRRGRRREEARLEAARSEAERRGRPAEGGALEAAELGALVKERVADLPDRQREVLVLHVYHELSHGEIAVVLACTYDDVKVNLSLARKKLREDLREYV